MAKLIIGKAPKTFPLAVEIPTPHGNDTVEFVAKHLSSTAWAELREAYMDGVNAEVRALFDGARAAAEDEYAAQQSKPKRGAAKAKEKPAEEVTDEAREAAIAALVKPIKESVLKRLRAKKAASMLMQITEGWDLEDEFSEDALFEMCNLYQAAAESVISKFNSVLEGRREGN